MFHCKRIFFLYLTMAFFQIQSITSSSAHDTAQEISCFPELETEPEILQSIELKVTDVKSEFIYASNDYKNTAVNTEEFERYINHEEKRALAIFEIPKSTEVPNLNREDKERIKELFTLQSYQIIDGRVHIAFTYQDENLLPENKEEAIALLYAANCKNNENKNDLALEDILNEKQAEALGKKKNPATHISKNPTPHAKIMQKYIVESPHAHEGLLGTTRVKTSTGHSALQDLKVGDFVECHDLKNQQITYSPITNADKVHLKDYIAITINGQELKVARHHRFYIPILQEWITAEALLNDANLCDYLDPNIQDVQLVNEELDVIRISVDSNHNFYITDNNILVHNYIPIVVEVYIAFEISQGVAFTWAVLGPSAIALATGLFYWVIGKAILESPPDLLFSPLPMQDHSNYFNETNSKQIYYTADNNTPPQNNPKNNSEGPGPSQDPNKNKKDSEIKIYDKNGQDKHIFRNEKGHLPDTPENRKLLSDVASDIKNRLDVDSRGNEWYAKNLPDGKQVWALVRNNVIRNGGINDTIRSFNKQTGLSTNIGSTWKQN